MSGRERAIEAAIECVRSLPATRTDRQPAWITRAVVDAYEAAMKDAGFVMVPVEPTPEMVAAGLNSSCWEVGRCIEGADEHGQYLRVAPVRMYPAEVYRAMLSARPASDTQ